jgi:hypothetical protein
MKNPSRVPKFGDETRRDTTLELLFIDVKTTSKFARTSCPLIFDILARGPVRSIETPAR